MNTCIFPGSFDPITRGHMDLIRRVAELFDQVIVTVMINREKSGTIPHKERVKIIRKACTGIPNVRVDFWDGLLSEYASGHPGSVIVRGVRNSGEFEREKTAAAINRTLCPGLETLLIPAADEWADVSSSAVREIASFGGDFSAFVPDAVYAEIRKWLISSENMNQ